MELYRPDQQNIYIFLLQFLFLYFSLRPALDYAHDVIRSLEDKILRNLARLLRNYR